MKILRYFLLTLIAFFTIFQVKDVEAFVYQDSGTLFTVPLQNAVQLMGRDGNYYFWSPSPSDAAPVSAYDTNASLLWQTAPLLLPSTKADVDESGNLIMYRSIPGKPDFYHNIHTTRILNNGTVDYYDSQLVDSMLYHVASSISYNYLTNGFFLFVNEGEFSNPPATTKSKLVLLNANGTLATPTRSDYKTLPYGRQSCTNNLGHALTIPYDIPIARWDLCWSWCEENMDATNALCQYNSDGPRNCWVDIAPAGGVDNCTWEDWGGGGGWPPYNGYYSMPDPLTTTFNIQQYADNSTGSTNTSRYFVDDTYVYIQHSVNSVTYIQQLNQSGTPLLAGNGLNVDTLIDSYEYMIFEMIGSEIYILYALDENLDSFYDTLYLQKVDINGNKLFDGNGVLIYQDLIRNIDVWPKMYASNDKLVILSDEWETVDWEDMTLYLQVADTNGTLKYEDNGRIVVDYTSELFNPQWLKHSSLTNDGRVILRIWGVDLTDASESERLFLVDTDGSLYFQDGGLEQDPTNAIIGCLGDGGEGFSCSEQFAATKYIRTYDPAYQIDPVDGFEVYDSEGNNITEFMTHGIGPDIPGYTDTITIKTTDGLTFANLAAIVDVDLDWSAMGWGIDETEGKSFVTSLAQNDKAASNVTLYVPIPAGQTSDELLVCPNASSFTEMSLSCTSGVRLGEEHANVSKVEISGVTYWKLQGVTGDVGLLAITPLVLENEDSNNDDNQEDEQNDDNQEGEQNNDDGASGNDSSGDSGQDPSGNGTGGGAVIIGVEVIDDGDDDSNEDSNEENDSGDDDSNDNGDTGGSLGGDDSSENDSQKSFFDQIVAKVSEFVVEVLESEFLLVVAAVTLPIMSISAYRLPLGHIEWYAYFINIYKGILAFLKPVSDGSRFGYVYDSITKFPISLAIVRAFDRKGKLVDTSVTNSLGKFDFDLPQDKYKFSFSHTGYKFPSSIVTGQDDMPIKSIYRGSLLEIGGSKGSQFSAPMDHDSTTIIDTSFYSVKSVIARVIQTALTILYAFGFVQSIYNLFYNPSLTSTLLFMLYIGSAGYIIYMHFATKMGTAEYNSNPIAGLEVLLYKTIGGEPIDKRVTDNNGKFSFVLSKGVYYIDVNNPRYGLSNPVKITNDSNRPVNIGIDLSLVKK